MAYVLGFWFADGYMRREKSYRIQFTSNDQETLHDVVHVLQSSHPIRKSRRDSTWQLVVHSRHLYERLTALGGLRKKSRVITFPKVPREYLRDFIRGYFDGDGSVFYVKYISTKNHKPRRELRSNFTSGSRRFLNRLMEVLYKEIGVTRKQLGIYNRGSSLKLGYGTKDTRKLLSFMYYKSFPLGLQRKARFSGY